MAAFANSTNENAPAGANCQGVNPVKDSIS